LCTWRDQRPQQGCLLQCVFHHLLTKKTVANNALNRVSPSPLAYTERQPIAQTLLGPFHTHANANVRTNNSCEQFASFALSNTIRANNWRINPIFDYFLRTICGRPGVVSKMARIRVARYPIPSRILRELPYFNQDLSVTSYHTPMGHAWSPQPMPTMQCVIQHTVLLYEL